MMEVDASTLRKLADLQTPSLNASDDVLKGVMEWFEQATYDMHHLVKYLPHTASDLRTGKVSPLQVAEEIISILKTIDVPFDRPDVTASKLSAIPGLSPSTDRQFINSLQLMNDLTLDTSLLIIPRHWTPRSVREDDLMLSVELTTNLHSSLCRLFCSGQPTTSTNPADFDQFLLTSLYTCVQELLPNWAPRLDNHYFQGETGAFLAKSPMGNATLEEYSKMMRLVREERELSQEEHYEKMLEALQLDLSVAATYVQQGVHEIMETCWECSKVGTPSRDLQRCGKCKVALYCGRDCQLKAWKCGHKKKCKTLLQRHTKLEEQFKIVDEAHFKRYLNGVRLQCELDYHVAQATVFSDEVLPGDGLSMRTYYENLSRVIKGEWWLVANTDSLPEYMARTMFGADDYSWMVSVGSQYLGLLLCTDFFTYATTNYGVSEPDDVTNLFHDALCKGMDHHGVEATVPAGCFLFMYESREYGPSTNPKVVRRHKKDYAYQQLKEKFHK